MDAADPLVGQPCPDCRTTLAYRGHLDGQTPDGSPFNVLLWECPDCGGRYCAIADPADRESLQWVVPQTWTNTEWWPIH